MIKKVRLGNIATVITKGTTPISLGYDFIENGINFVKIESINEDGDFIKDKFAHITDECNEKLNRSQLQENDILFSIAGAIGRVAIVDKSILPANTNQALAIIRVPKGIYEYNFLKYILKSPVISKQFEKQKQGVAQINLSLKNISDFEIPLISLEQQRQVSLVLDKVSDLINKRKEQLGKLDEFVKARFVELFGGVNNSKIYPYKAVKELTEVISGGTPSREVNEYWEGGTIPWVKTTELKNNIITEIDEHITEAGLDNSSAKLVPAGTVLIAMYGQGKTRGMTGYLGVEACTNQACACILPSDSINQMFLWQYFVLSYDNLRDMAKGGNQPNLNGNIIKNYPVLYPPIELQNQFATFVQQTDKSKLEIQKSLEKLELLKKALMQKYFG